MSGSECSKAWLVFRYEISDLFLQGCDAKSVQKSLGMQLVVEPENLQASSCIPVHTISLPLTVIITDVTTTQSLTT